MLISSTFKPPYNFDLSKNKEYTALRIAGGDRRRKIESIESTLLTGGVAPPRDAARRKTITPSTIRSKPIAPSRASRSRNDSRLLICESQDGRRLGSEAVQPERNPPGPVVPHAVIYLHRASEVQNDHAVSLCSWHSL